MRLPNVTGEFRCAADPELRFTPSGTAVANLRAVATSRKKEGDEWVDDKSCWVNITVWQQMAENVVETLTKGDLFFLQGRLETREYENREGEKRISVDITADVIGPSVTFATATVHKTDRRSGDSGGQQRQQQQSQQGGDPWSTPPSSDEPPF